jgi:ATP-binding cassette subfamily C protein CydC
MIGLIPLARVLAAGHRGRLALGLALAGATVLAGLGLLGLSGWFLTATGLAGASVATALAFDVFAPGAGIRLLAILRTGARYGERLATHDAALAVLAQLRERLFRGWAGAAGAGALRRRPARLLFRLTLDVDALDALYLRGVVPAAALVAGAAGLGLGLGLMQPLTGLAAATLLLLAGLGLPALALARAHRPARDRTRLLETLRAGSVDLVQGQTDLLMAGRLAAQRARLAAADARLATADAALDRIDRQTGLALALTGTVLLAGTLVAVAALAGAGRITAPVAAFGVLAALAVAEPFAALRRAGTDLARARLAAARLGDRLIAEPPAEPRLPVPHEGLAVALSGVRLRHPGAAAPVLDRVDLAISAGERVAIVGPSGCGKSSLIAALAGALPPEAGRVAALPATCLTQRTDLFRDSLADNLRLADPAAPDAALEAALDDAGLTATIASLPGGLATPLGEAGLGLSGGQARRLAVARARLHDRPLWLMDEPTDGLDAATAAEVLDRLARAAAGRTLVIATHLRREAALADRILVMGAGRLTAEARRDSPAFRHILSGLRPD